LNVIRVAAIDGFPFVTIFLANNLYQFINEAPTWRTLMWTDFGYKELSFMEGKEKMQKLALINAA